MQVPPNSGYLANDVQPGGPSETWHEAYAPLDHHRDQYPTTASLEPFLASPAITVDHQMVGDEVITAVTGGGDLLDGGRLFACQDCDKQFPRHCDLKKHSNSHIRPYKCPVRDCKYHDLGWPSEKELTRHHNDKHASSPCTFHCHFSQCAYTSKRESNCKQHMEKVHGWNYVRSRLTKPYKCPVAGCLTCADQVESREKHPEYPALEAAAAAMASSPSRLVAQPQADFELFGDADPSAHDETAFYPWTSPESRFRRHTDILQTFGNNGSVIAGQAMTPVDPNLAAMSFGTVAFSDSVDLGASQPGRRHSAAVMGGSSTGALDAMVVQPSSQQAGQHSAMLTPASTVLGPESVRVYAMSRSGSTDQTPLKRFPPLDTTSLGDAMSKGLFTPSDEEKSGRPAPSSAQTVDICVSGFGTMHHVKPESASTGGGVGVAHWVDGQPTSFLTSTALLDDNQADDGDDDDDEEDEPPRKRTKQSAQDTFDETNMLCPFHVAYPDKYNVNQMQTYGSCHTKHRDISTIVRHLKRSAHRLKVDERSISSFDVEMVPHVHPAVGLCRSCWRAYTDRDEFERHLQEPCANVSRGKREKYNALKDTFCPIILDDGRILPPAVPFGQPSFDMAVSRGDSVAAPDHFGQIGESRSDILDTAVSVQPPTSLRGGSEGGEAVVKLSEHLALQRRVETLERSISTILQAWQQPSGNVTVTAPPTPMNLTGASLSYGTDLSMQGHAAGQQQANATGSAKQEHGGADQQQQHHHLADFGDASGLNMLSDMNARKALSLSTTGHHQPHDHHSLSPTPRYHNVVSESPTTMIAAAHRGSVVAAGPRSQSLDRRPKRPYGSGSGYELHAGLEQDVQRRFVHTPQQQQQQQQQQSLHQQQQQQHQHQGNQARLHGQAGGGAGFIPRTTAQQQLPDTVDWSLAPMGIGEDELADSFSTSYVSGPNTLP